MADIRFEVKWGDASGDMFAADDELSVDELIDIVRKRADSVCPELDDDGHRIEYALFSNADNYRDPLVPRSSLRQAGITDQVILHFADLTRPRWWVRNQPPPPPPGAEYICRLRLAAGRVISVPPDGLRLDRGYLLQSLPAWAVIVERFKIFIGLDTRLDRVSRELHCEILRQGDQWLLRAFHPTYINQAPIDGGDSLPITLSTQIVLGREGWPIDIQLAPR